MLVTEKRISKKYLTDAKVITFEEFNERILPQSKNKKIIQCHGVFDLLHIGHIKHLEHAKSLGNILVVTITPDRYVNKGLGRPYFPEQLRAEALAALHCVDYVIINDNPTAVEAIKNIKPHLYVKGVEYQDAVNDVTGKIIDEEQAVKLCGGEIYFTQDIVYSSSTLLNRFFSHLPAEVTAYLNRFKQLYHINDVLKYLENAQKLKVLLIGESIIDIYHFGEAIGKSGKEPVLVTKYNREETYIGGVLAVANHLSSFCSEITCMSMLGNDRKYESFIRENLKKNITSLFHYKKDSPTIVKRRYLEEYTLQKLFEIYEINDCYLENQQKNEFLDCIAEHAPQYDLVIVADYGHGLLDDDCINEIQKKSKFLAVNTQSNASNHGFNCISKYKNADYVCIATRELQLNYRQKHISVIDQLRQLVNDYDYNNIVITHGRDGAYSYRKEQGIYEVPAFATTIKDRVGAGDAVLAITSLCVLQNAPAEIVGFIGNIVGAEAVSTLCNKEFIDKVSLMKHIVQLLK